MKKKMEALKKKVEMMKKAKEEAAGKYANGTGHEYSWGRKMIDRDLRRSCYGFLLFL